jgi:WD40 repeat protein
VFILVNQVYENSVWNHREFIEPHIESHTSSDVKTLVCIKETRIKTGSYTGGQTSYQLNWDVRLIRWSDSAVIAQTQFDGGLPPLTIPSTANAGYGSQPEIKFYKWLVSVINDKTILSYDDRFEAVAFSPDGKILASVADRGGNYIGILWDVMTGEKLKTYEMINYLEMEFSSGGEKVVFFPSFDFNWNILSGQALNTINNSKSCEVQGIWISTSPNGKVYAELSGDTIVLCDTATGKQLQSLSGQESVYAVVFSPDGKKLATATRNQSRDIEVWDVETGQLIRTITATQTSSLAFSPDGKFLASSAEYDFNIVRLWKISTGQLVQNFIGHSGTVNGLAFSPDGKILATASSDHTIKLWDVATGR